MPKVRNYKKWGMPHSIIGLVGWSKKSFSVVGLIFSLIPILLVAVGLSIAIT